MLGLEIDNKLKFDKHIDILCRKSAQQLNALFRISSFLGSKEKVALINSFIYGNFNYCPLVWHFCPTSFMRKIEKIQKRALRFVLDDFSSDYDTLLEKSNTCTMEIKRLRTLALEVFKSLNNLNPPFMKELFEVRQKSVSRKYDLVVPSRKTVAFGDKSLKCLGPKVWNSLPSDIKSMTNIEQFKIFLNTWYGPTCKCNFCNFLSRNENLCIQK